MGLAATTNQDEGRIESMSKKSIKKVKMKS